MPGVRRLPFASTPFSPGGHPLERKKTDGNVALLEFAPGFEDPNWCTRGHVLFVVSGTLEIVTQTGVERVETGEACVVDAGAPHRARNGATDPVVLFVTSSEEAAPRSSR